MQRFLPALLFLCSFLLSQSAQSQHFDWAITAVNMQSGFQKACTDAQGNTVVATCYMRTEIDRGRAELIGGLGSSGSSELYPGFVIACYGPSGREIWRDNQVNAYNQGSMRVGGMCVMATGELAVLVLGVPPTNQHHPLTDKKFPTSALKSGWSILTYSPQGRLTAQYELLSAWVQEPGNMAATPDSGLIVTGFDDNPFALNGNPIDMGRGGSNYLMKFNIIDGQMQPQWVRTAKYMRESCCSYFEPPCLVAVAENGDVYTAGTGLNGLQFTDGTKTETHLSPLKGNLEFKLVGAIEGYVACYSASGSLKWVKATESRFQVQSLSLKGKKLMVGGTLYPGASRLWGQKVDTSWLRPAAFSVFDLSQGVGKVAYTQMIAGEAISGIVADNDGNVYATGIQRWTGRPGGPILYGTDTLNNRIHGLFVVSYDAKGKYRWVKGANVPLKGREALNLTIDNCGNLAVSGSLWFILPAQMAIFDKAFASGRGYGEAPFLARLRNSFEVPLAKTDTSKTTDSTRLAYVQRPLDSLKIDSLSAFLAISTDSLNVATSQGGTNVPNTPNTPSYLNGTPGSCMISPGPYTLRARPNPMNGNGEGFLDYVTTLPDPSVSIDLYDMRGNFIRTLMKPRGFSQPTSGSEPVPLPSLNPGAYLAILKGANGACNAQIIVAK